MKQLANTILNFGIEASQSPYDQRRVRAANLLNVVIIVSLLVGYTNYFFLKSDFATGPVTLFLLLAVCSLVLSRYHFTSWSFALFTFNANLSIFFVNEQYPVEAGAYLYYFPILVSVVLLVNPSLRDRFSVLHLGICVLFMLTSVLIDLPGIRLTHLTTQTLTLLWIYNLIISLFITVLISFMLTRLILKQNEEIVTRNEALLRSRVDVDNSLKEKEVLLAELHHRVKNNLAIISGLLNLQQGAVKSPEALQVIGDTRHRIMSMAMVHKMLYNNQDLKSIDIGKYSSELVSGLFGSARLTDRVKVIEDYDCIALSVDKSIPLGLILNEIVTNSIKYAYLDPLASDPYFSISIRNRDGKIELLAQDSGAGFPLDMNTHESSSSLGIFLIKSLTEQIDGQVYFSNAAGARVALSFAGN